MRMMSTDARRGHATVWRRCYAALLLACLLPFLPGCLVAGVLAGKTSTVKVHPHYLGLTNQSVSVMVWASRPTRIDFPHLQLAIAQGVDKKLIDAQAAKAVELV